MDYQLLTNIAFLTQVTTVLPNTGCIIVKLNVTLGVVQKLRLQDKVGRWFINVHFFQRLYHRKCQHRGVGGQEQPKSCQRSL